MNIDEMNCEEKLEYIKALHQDIKDLKFENDNLQERNNRQKETIEKQQDKIENYIDIKAKLEGKIKEYETKSEEYELSACGCGSKHNWIKKTALEEFRDEIYGDKNNSQC